MRTSWAIAPLEYIFQVAGKPHWFTNVYGQPIELMQECITLVVFTVIAYVMFGETLKWNNLFPTG